MINTVSVCLHGRGKAIQFDPGTWKIRRGDAVIVETEQGLEYGIAVGEPMMLPRTQNLPPVLRLATADDERRYEENCGLEREAFKTAWERIGWFGLDMRLVDAEYLFDNRRIIFYFTADGRVDFRELVKDLASIFRTRIELRQIGVRDEARLLGGLGQCGRELCCSTFLKQFSPVTIRMAKEQNLSMNPQKISGACGRLLCCLTYEQEAYEDANRRVPQRGSIVDTPQGRGVVESSHLLRETVAVRLDAESDEPAKRFSLDQIEVLSAVSQRRTGKRRPPSARN